MLLMTQTTNHRRGVQCVISTIPISNVAIKIMDGLCVFVYPQHCNNNEIKSTLHQRLQLWSLQAPCVGASQVVTPQPHLARLPDSQTNVILLFCVLRILSSQRSSLLWGLWQFTWTFRSIQWHLTRHVIIDREGGDSFKTQLLQRSNQNANAESWSL